MDYLNGFHKSIKFTFEIEYEKRTTHWLDCQITMENGTITTDLYRKPESSVQYLLPSSCHPPHCWKNIPYSVAFRLRRICSVRSHFPQKTYKRRRTTWILLVWSEHLKLHPFWLLIGWPKNCRNQTFSEMWIVSIFGKQKKCIIETFWECCGVQQ